MFVSTKTDPVTLTGMVTGGNCHHNFHISVYCTFCSSLRATSVDEVDAKGMEDKTAENVVRKGSLGTDLGNPLLNNLARHSVHGLGSRLFGSRRCCRWWQLCGLHAKRGRKYELSHSSGEAREKRVEWLESTSVPEIVR